MSSAPAPQEIAANATWLPQALDPASGLIRLVRMDAASYRAASFLDDRMFQAPQTVHVVPADAVSSALQPDARRDARWIFHIGHVGSTLLARLLGELPGILSIREPRILRDLAGVSQAARTSLAPALTALLSRTFAPDQTALVKATSFVSEIAPKLVPAGQRALFLFASPQAYIEGILAGENSVKELRMLAGSRAQRMAGRAAGLHDVHTGDARLAAAAWACEMTALEAAAEAMPDRHLLWADFDQLLRDMPAGLERIASFFGFRSTTAELRSVGTGPLMRSYSKALEFDYSPNLRRELLEDARCRHGAAIEDALAMLDSVSPQSPLLRTALDRAGREI